MNQSPFQSILSHFRKSALSERDKGDKFERLIQAYPFLIGGVKSGVKIFTSGWCCLG